MSNLLDWDRILKIIMGKEADNEESAYRKYLNDINDMKKFKWAASGADEIRRLIGEDFDRISPIILNIYSVELYVLDQDSALLTFMKGGKIASDINGRMIDFFLTQNPSRTTSEIIEDGEVILDFRKLDIPMEGYKKVSFRLHLDDSTVIDGSFFNGKCHSD